MKSLSILRCGWAAAAALIVAAGVARGHGMLPEHTPYTRIVQNMEARIKEDPNDAHAYYVLGRTHALVFETKNNNVLTFNGPGAGPEPAPGGWHRRLGGAPADSAPSEEELKAHLTQAITSLKQAIQLDPTKADYHLALASILEAGQGLIGKVSVYAPITGTYPELKPNPWIDDIVATMATNRESYEACIRHLRLGMPLEQGGPTWREVLVDRLLLVLNEPPSPRRQLAEQLLAEDWREQITEHYFQAMCLALPEDGRVEALPMWGSKEDWVAYEAATCYTRIIKARGERPDEHVRLAVASATVKAFDTLPRPGGITPVIFSFDNPAGLSDLLDPSATTRFDLDATGRGLLWPWLRPDTGVLVWDPTESGSITSGKQLFGSVSWWLFFRNGYEALDALDDDRDGLLAGAELAGIGVWHDRDQNGVSDPGEVTAIARTPIVAISCRIDGVDTGCPMSKGGIVLTDGRRLPSFDWITSPVEPESQPTNSVFARTIGAGVLATAGFAGLIARPRFRRPLQQAQR